MSEPSLIDRLLAHRTLGSVPRTQLEWLASVGTMRQLQSGDLLAEAGKPVAALFVLLSGHTAIRVDHGSGPHIVMEWHGGDVSGMLPYSRLAAAPGNVRCESPTEVLAIDASHLPHMMRDCHELTGVLVHVMLDRARVFTSSAMMDEKMASLGRLAAGLAHELNNPASAVARSAKALMNELRILDEKTKQFCLLTLSETQCRAIDALRNDRAPLPVGGSPLDAADREDALSEWLDDHGISEVDCKPLAAMDFGPRDLSTLSATIGGDELGVVLSHMATGHTVRALAGEINAAASRIHALVGAVKGFTYMDQQTTPQPVDIARGLSDTITVLGAKARAQSVTIELDIAPDLPMVDGFGGELNQVWSNLLDNAIDAAPKGRVRILASVPIDHVVVRIIDTGPGIPPEVVARIFDPFFTTKPVGQGTGLGLDIAHRIVHKHHGVIDVHTGADGTEFRVSLPVSKVASTSH